MKINYIHNLYVCFYFLCFTSVIVLLYHYIFLLFLNLEEGGGCTPYTKTPSSGSSNEMIENLYI